MNNYLIVGVSSGIGKELTKQIEASGNQVIGTFHRHEPEVTASNIQFHHMEAFLVSDKASWITGQILHIDGGMASLKTH
ncbi:MAG: hypothetical protein O3B82_03245 [Bacteroidetes bacterium]|nr:hypothetical protein [Bacteroidota bacterium]